MTWTHSNHIIASVSLLNARDLCSLSLIFLIQCMNYTQLKHNHCPDFIRIITFKIEFLLCYDFFIQKILIIECYSCRMDKFKMCLTFDDLLQLPNYNMTVYSRHFSYHYRLHEFIIFRDFHQNKKHAYSPCLVHVF